MVRLAQQVPLAPGVREAGMGLMDHPECEALMVLQGLLENQEPLARMVRQVFQEVLVIKGTLERLVKREALAWMVPEEMQANQESPEKEEKWDRLAKMVKMEIKVVRDPLVLQGHLECQAQEETQECRAALVPGEQRALLEPLDVMD